MTYYSPKDIVDNFLPISVADFGAVGDGATNDTNAINAAFSAIRTAGGGTLQFKPGKTYFIGTGTIGSTGVSDYINNCTVIGYGSTIKASLNAAGVSFALHGNNVRIYGLTYDHVTGFVPSGTIDSGPSDSGAIRIGGNGDAGSPSSGITVQDVTVKTSHGFGIIPYWGRHVTIKNCIVRNVMNAGIFIANCVENILVDGCFIENTGDDGLMNDISSGNTAGKTLNLVYTNNIIKNNRAKCLGLAAVWGGVISNNVLSNSYSAAIHIEANPSVYATGNTSGILIKNNVIERPGQYRGVSGIFASEGANAHGIEINNSNFIKDVQIIGNIIHDGSTGGYSMLIGSVDKLIVADNTITSGGIGINIGIAAGTFTATDFSIHNNILRNTRSDAIDCYYYANGAIKNNNIRSYGAAGGLSNAGILVSNCTGFNVRENDIWNTNGAESEITFISTVSGYQSNNYVYGGNYTNPTSTLLGCYGNSIGSIRTSSDTAPSVGQAVKGDFAFNSSPDIGEPMGWQCTSAGTPGTWESIGTLGQGVNSFTFNNSSGTIQKTTTTGDFTTTSTSYVADGSNDTVSITLSQSGIVTVNFNCLMGESSTTNSMSGYAQLIRVGGPVLDTRVCPSFAAGTSQKSLTLYGQEALAAGTYSYRAEFLRTVNAGSSTLVVSWRQINASAVVRNG